MAIKALRRNTISSPKHIRRKKRLFWWQVGLTNVAIASLVFALYAAFHYEPLIIARVQVDGVSTISADSVLAEVNSALDGSYALGIIPKSNTIFYPKVAVSETLLGKWPEIKSLHVARQGAQAISVLLQEREPVYVWCPMVGDSATGTTTSVSTGTHATSTTTERGDTSCLLADETGFLYGIAPHMTSDTVRTQSLLLSDDTKPVILDASGEEKGIRDSFLPQALFDRLKTFLAQGAPLFTAAIKVVKIKPEHQAEAVLADGTRILFTLDQDIPLALTNLSLFLQKQTGPFQYIDIRYSNKVYFKARS
jgi:hypothetical protein